MLSIFNIDIYRLTIYNEYIDNLYMEARMEIDRSLVSGSMALLVMKLLEDGDMYGYQMTEELKNGPKAKGCEKIFLPGEMEWEKREVILANGEMEMTDAMAASLQDLSERTGIEISFV